MSSRRSIFYLLALIGVVVGANLWLDISGDQRREVVRRRSLVGGADSAVAIELRSRDGFIRLERDDRWRIVRPVSADADQAAVVRLTDRLAFGPLGDSIEESHAVKLGNRLSDFGMDRPSLTLRVITPIGSTLVRFGSKTPSGDGVYAVVDGSSVLYIVPDETFSAVDLSVESLRRRNVLRVNPEEVVLIDIRRGEGYVRLSRVGDHWEMVEPRSAKASPSAVRGIFDTVLSCKARTFVWPVGATNESSTASLSLLAGYGLDPESCETVIFRTADGRDHSLSFGSAADTDSVYALIQEGTAVATVDASAKSTVSLDASALIDGRIFPLEKSSIRWISMKDGEVSYLLARGDDSSWRLDSPVSAAADALAVSALVDRLLVMRNADVEDDGVKVTLSADSAPQVVSREALLGSAGFEQFRSKTVLDIGAATVRRLVFAPAGAETAVSVVFDPDRKGWNVESSPGPCIVDTDRLNAVLAALAPLKAVSVARLKVSPGELARYGLETPACTIAVDRLIEDSVRRNILIGNVLNQDGDAYATVGSTDAVFVLDGKTVKTLREGVVSE